jgi:hypothetical protein
MKIVRTNRWLKKLSRAAAVIALAAATQAAWSRSALAQDGSFRYGRQPAGSATEAVTSNRDGFGVQFRGGHTAGDTVGRSDSITHINLVPYINIDDGLFFADTRLLRANEGGLAWSFGGGYRHYIADWDVVLGGNGYFDRDELTGAHLKQWGVGAELLAHQWELRGNLYETFGETFDLVGQSIAPGSAAFQGNNITFTRVDTFAEALRGFDYEAGVLMPGEFSERIDLRGFAGGYWYEGDNIDSFAGWSTRLQADIGRWLELNLKLTDDELFDTTVSFAAVVHFGGFESQEHTKRSAIQRFRDPVRRNMNIVATTTGVDNPGQIATNPDNGLPFTVAHVNSNDVIGPFNGTVENPFNTLTQGLGAGTDIVFVHAGSQFNAAPQNTVVLANGQQLIGEGFIQNGRNVMTTVQVAGLGQTFDLLLPDSPTFAANPNLTRPVLGNSAGNAVTLANDTQFSGFVVSNPVGHGVFSNGARDTFINDVLITGAGDSGIALLNTDEDTAITNTTIVHLPGATGPAFHVDGGDGRISFTSTDSFLLAQIDNTAAQNSVLIENMNDGRVDMSRSSIVETGGLGILIRNNTGGSATIDNPTITNSGATGIAIVDSSGTYNIRKTGAQAAISIDNAAQQSIFVSNVSGAVTFGADVLITSRNAEGIEITGGSDRTTFSDNVTITGLGAGIGLESALHVHNQLADGAVLIDGDLTIQGAGGSRASLGNGILLEGNNADSVFVIEEDVAIDGTDLESILITNNDGSVAFNGTTTITERAVEGISVLNSAGRIAFGVTQGDLTTVLNDNIVPSTSAAIELIGNSAEILFRSTVVDSATGNVGGGAGLHVVGNTNTVNFDVLDVTSTAGTGVFGLDNTLLSIQSGDILSVGETAVDIENSGIEIRLQSVTSTAPPDYGIRLVETNKDGNKTFEVDPNTINVVAGDGGTISDADGDGLDNDDAAGVFLQNAGQVELRGMLLDDNEFGVRIRNTETTAGLPDNTKQSFTLLESAVEDSDIRGIDSRDLFDLFIDDSAFNDNGDDAASGRETILLDYTVRLDADTIVRFEQADDPFFVRIEDTDFVSTTTDVINISQSSATANGAAIQVELLRNTFNVSDTSDPTGSGVFDDAFIFDWNGPVRAFIEGNLFDMNSVNQAQAISFRTRSTTDLTELSIQTNTALVNNVTASLGAFDVEIDGPALMDTVDFRVAENDIVVDDGVTGSGASGGRPTGMRFDLVQNSGLALINNDIVSNADGGTGILIARAAAVSDFVINGNRIGFADLGTGNERGIVFSQVTGVVNLFGNVNNQIIVLQSAAPGNNFVETPFFMPIGSNNGQIVVNGVLVP